MIIGAQKCATTTLYTLLATHPMLQGSWPKETHFFSFDADWRHNLSRYHALFEQRPRSLYFEASTTYTFPSRQELGLPPYGGRPFRIGKQGAFHPIHNASIAEDLHAYNPDLKFIYLVRRPIKRIVSAYMHAYARRYTDLGLVEELEKNPLHVEVTRYATRIQPFLEQFGRRRVLILDFDDLVTDRKNTIERIAAFLEIPAADFQLAAKVHENATVGHGKLPVKWDEPNYFWIAFRKFFPKLWYSYARKDERGFNEPPVLPPSERQHILDRLSPEIDALEKLLNKDLSHWRN